MAGLSIDGRSSEGSSTGTEADGVLARFERIAARRPDLANDEWIDDEEEEKQIDGEATAEEGKQDSRGEEEEDGDEEPQKEGEDDDDKSSSDEDDAGEGDGNFAAVMMRRRVTKLGAHESEEYAEAVEEAAKTLLRRMTHGESSEGETKKSAQPVRMSMTKPKSAKRSSTFVAQVLPAGWSAFLTDGGRPYYFNVLSNETTWELPRVDGSAALRHSAAVDTETKVVDALSVLHTAVQQVDKEAIEKAMLDLAEKTAMDDQFPDCIIATSGSFSVIAGALKKVGDESIATTDAALRVLRRVAAAALARDKGKTFARKLATAQATEDGRSVVRLCLYLEAIG